MKGSELRPGERVKDVRFTQDTLAVDLLEGRTILVPFVSQASRCFARAATQLADQRRRKRHSLARPGRGSQHGRAPAGRSGRFPAGLCTPLVQIRNRRRHAASATSRIVKTIFRGCPDFPRFPDEHHRAPELAAAITAIPRPVEMSRARPTLSRSGSSHRRGPAQCRVPSSAHAALPTQ